MIKGKVSILVPDVSSLGTIRAYIIAQGLKKMGYQVQILGFIFAEQIYPQPPVGIPITYIAGSNLPNLLKTAFKFLKNIDGDILYVIKPKLTSLGLALIKRLRSKKPIILDFDGWDMEGDELSQEQYQGNFLTGFFLPQPELKNPHHPFYNKWLEKSFDRLNGLTVSSKLLQFQYGGTYVPNAIDTDIYDPQKFESEKIKQHNGLDKFKLLMCLGNIKPNQGIENILQALQTINNPQLRLVLVGGNPLYQDYRQQLLETWQPWVILTAPKPFQETAVNTSIADIIVIPSSKDTSNTHKFPFELIEAMAMAKPIIAPNLGEITAILDDTGYLVPPHDVDQLAQQIRFILNHEQEAQDKAQLARQRCQENYSIDNLTSILEQVIMLAHASV